MRLEEINAASNGEIIHEFERCCGSRRWAEAMVLARPFSSPQSMFETADAIWHKLGESDWKEAFSHHPRIGDIDSLRTKFADTAQWAEGEQKGVQQATEQVLHDLASGNDDYFEKFGYIFIVFATGKSAPEMLKILQSRIGNSPDKEIHNAMQEQSKITRLRLEKLLA